MGRACVRTKRCEILALRCVWEGWVVGKACNATMYKQGDHPACLQEVMQSVSGDEILRKGSQGGCSSFVVFVQKFFEMTAIAPKSTAILAILYMLFS